jgi:hypothetical protein
MKTSFEGMQQIAATSTTAQVCDATKFDSSNKAGYTKKTCWLRAGSAKKAFAKGEKTEPLRFNLCSLNILLALITDFCQTIIIYENSTSISKTL